MKSTTYPLVATFVDPPQKFGMIPFWFWNDDLTEEELLRQIQEFHAAGFGGFLPHARVGLSRRVGYLTEEFFRLMRAAVAEAARLEMQVVLYDEGSYPSGSAQGRVVAENPDHAARCIFPLHKSVQGPATGYWRPNPGRALRDELLCVTLAREVGVDAVDGESLTLLPIQEPELVRYDVPAGEWRLTAVWSGFSGGAIRGVFAEEEDGHAQAPAAGDLLNPEAVACFMRHTHEQYFAHLQEYFGSTIVAMFTDEPSVLGRGGGRRGKSAWPYTPGFLQDLQDQWDQDVLRWLPALWLDCGPGTAEFRAMVERAVYDRLERVFYAAQSQWCAAHGIALTGHPTDSDELGVLRQFQWPGQDMVWRYVEPGKATALEGKHSTAAKTAASAAALQGAPRNGTELFGAYGWQLSLDEAKWLLDWHLVRGNNLFIPHAAFYSLRGRRAYESEPDIFLHNVWRAHWPLLAHYTRRLSWLLSDGEEVCRVALLTDPNHAAWATAKVLYQNQIDFLYITPTHLTAATVDGATLTVNGHPFQAVICDPPGMAPDHPTLNQFQSAGGLVLDGNDPNLLAALLATVDRDLHWPEQPDVRVLHYRKAGIAFYLLVNEGEKVCTGPLSLAQTGTLSCWNPLDGSVRPWPGQVIEGRLVTHLRLERRQALVLAVESGAEPLPAIPLPPSPGPVIDELAGPWHAVQMADEKTAPPCPGNWALAAGWETYAGSLTFQTDFSLSTAWIDRPLFLDLGQVGQIAQIWVNGKAAGVRAWAPYLFEISGLFEDGVNQLTVQITNSAANYYDGAQLPSGLMGPITLRRADETLEPSWKVN